MTITLSVVVFFSLGFVVIRVAFLNNECGFVYYDSYQPMRFGRNGRYGSSIMCNYYSGEEVDEN